MQSNPDTYTDRIERNARRERAGKCTRCRPHGGENRRYSGRKSKSKK